MDALVPTLSKKKVQNTEVRKEKKERTMALDLRSISLLFPSLEREVSTFLRFMADGISSGRR